MYYHGPYYIIIWYLRRIRRIKQFFFLYFLVGQSSGDVWSRRYVQCTVCIYYIIIIMDVKQRASREQVSVICYVFFSYVRTRVFSLEIIIIIIIIHIRSFLYTQVL